MTILMRNTRSFISQLNRSFSCNNKGLCLRKISSSSTVFGENKVGYIVGVYSDEKNTTFTEAASKINEESSGRLSHLLSLGKEVKSGSSRVLYGVSDQYPVVAVVGLDPKNKEYSALEERDGLKENIRTSIAAGCKALKDSGLEAIKVDFCNDGEAAAEGAILSLFQYQDLKSKKKPSPKILPFNDESNESWASGATLAEGQNIARKLMETPSNILTPTNFAQEAVNILEGLGVEVLVRTYEWMKQRNMNSFLAVSQGSAEPPVFLEITYKGTESNNPPLSIVGKGVTFDTGGISLKPPGNMDKMRGDMGGAACTVGSIFCAAALQLPLVVKGFIPLCENMPSGTAIKPGDVVTASNGKTIQIDNTDAEGRLILADALHYASQHNPAAIVDMATLTGAIAVALGAGAAGTYSNSDALWSIMHRAGGVSGDRVWRMPLWDMYSKQVTEFGLADVHNIGKHDRDAGSCTAASFLQEFVTCKHWMHLDIAGVMENKDEVPYLGAGMSGRPTRTVAQFMRLFSQEGLK